jgi:hypothetical protein
MMMTPLSETPTPAQIRDMMPQQVTGGTPGRIYAAGPTRATRANAPASLEAAGPKLLDRLPDEATGGAGAPSGEEELRLFKQVNEQADEEDIIKMFQAAGANDDTIQRIFATGASVQTSADETVGVDEDEKVKYNYLLNELFKKVQHQQAPMPAFPTVPVTGLQYQQPEVFRGPDEIVKMIGNAQTQVQPATPASGGIGGALSNVFSGWAGAGPR